MTFDRLHAFGTLLDVTIPSDPIAVEDFRRVVSGEEYPLPEGLDLEPDVIVDVGAHIGAASLYFGARFPRARVEAFEPSPEVYSLLAQNLGGVAGAVVHNAGLGVRDERRPLFRGLETPLQSSLVRSAETASVGEVVEIREASAAIGRLGTIRNGILKLDTEGFELAILSAISSHLDVFALIFLEYHAEIARRSIDDLLHPRFVLATARARMPHRGTLGYLRADRIPC